LWKEKWKKILREKRRSCLLSYREKAEKYFNL
jgi:hypothetical protein